MSVQEVEAAIAQLSRDERAQVRVWLDEFEADAWDRQIEEDAETGRLDAVFQKAGEFRAMRQKRPRPYALAAGEFVVPDEFFAPLPEEILRDFEGG